MGAKLVVRFSISEMGGALRQVRDLIVNPTNKVVVGGHSGETTGEGPDYAADGQGRWWRLHNLCDTTTW